MLAVLCQSLLAAKMPVAPKGLRQPRVFFKPQELKESQWGGWLSIREGEEGIILPSMAAKTDCGGSSVLAHYRMRSPGPQNECEPFSKSTNSTGRPPLISVMVDLWADLSAPWQTLPIDLNMLHWARCRPRMLFNSFPCSQNQPTKIGRLFFCLARSFSREKDKRAGSSVPSSHMIQEILVFISYFTAPNTSQLIHA